MAWSIPNILTVLRLLAAPGLALMFLCLPRPFADFAALALFVLASLTDWLDGHLARSWKQTSNFGAMLDPIADKAMVALAFLVLAALWGMTVWIMVPATLILFREVFVSGLREFLGAQAGLLQVTKVAKWKTTAQMVAIAVLLSQGIFEHYFGMWTFGMDAALIDEVLSGRTGNDMGLLWVWYGYVGSTWIGLGMLWIATGLTVWTGWDYFQKALPFLRG